MVMVRNGHSRVVKLLVEQEGIDANVKSRIGGDTALHVASERGHANVVKLLLKKRHRGELQEQFGTYSAHYSILERTHKHCKVIAGEKRN